MFDKPGIYWAHRKVIEGESPGNPGWQIVGVQENNYRWVDLTWSSCSNKMSQFDQAIYLGKDEDEIVKLILGDGKPQ